MFSHAICTAARPNRRVPRPHRPIPRNEYRDVYRKTAARPHRPIPSDSEQPPQTRCGATGTGCKGSYTAQRGAELSQNRERTAAGRERCRGVSAGREKLARVVLSGIRVSVLSCEQRYARFSSKLRAQQNVGDLLSNESFPGTSGR